MVKIGFVIFGILVLISLAEVLVANCFIKKIIVSKKAKAERLKKLHRMNLDKYIPIIKKKRNILMSHIYEIVRVKSVDNLNLKGILFKREGSKKIVICFHEYTSKGLADFTAISNFYLDMGYNMLIVDERGHGKSEGKYIGLGYLEKDDAVRWINYAIERYGEECEIVLHGIAMGGTTAVMTSSMDLPSNVKCIISDSGYTSASKALGVLLKSIYHIVFPLPTLFIANMICKRIAGYKFNECNVIDEVKKSKLPILFIHGEKDKIVPCSMCYDLYNNCKAPKDILIVKEAGHEESYYIDSKSYEEKVKNFIIKYV